MLFRVSRQVTRCQVTECGLVVPKYFWVLSMELLVTYLDAKNFEVAPGLFENLRTPGLRHWTFLKRKSHIGYFIKVA